MKILIITYFSIAGIRSVDTPAIALNDFSAMLYSVDLLLASTSYSPPLVQWIFEESFVPGKQINNSHNCIVVVQVTAALGNGVQTSGCPEIPKFRDEH